MKGIETFAFGIFLGTAVIVVLLWLNWKKEVDEKRTNLQFLSYVWRTIR